MKEKVIIFLISIFIFVLFGFLFNFYLKDLFQKVKYQPIPLPFLEKKEPTFQLPLKRITNIKEIDEILYEKLSAVLAPEVLNKVSLVNLVHIRKEKGKFFIECEFGPLYETSGLELFYPKELISMGRIKECSLAVAELIDQIAKTPKRDCRVPLFQPIPKDLNDYYLITLSWNLDTMTPEKAEQFSKNLPECKEKFFEMIGKRTTIGGVVGILDLKEKVFYP